MYSINNVYPDVLKAGALLGTPMVFLRLHGCFVGCAECKFQETWVFNPVNERAQLTEAFGKSPLYARCSADVIGDYIVNQYPRYKWVLLTGGEPASHSLYALVIALQKIGYQVALNTSGTATGHLGAPLDWVSVHPKFNKTGRKVVIPESIGIAHELIMEVSTEHEVAQFREFIKFVRLRPDVLIYLKPARAELLPVCIEYATLYNWRVSLSIHEETL